MNLYSDTFDFEKFYNETKDDDMYCIVFNLIEDIEYLKEKSVEHDAEVIEKFLNQEAPRIDPDIPIPLEDQHCCENT